jgi:YNFM family putative membrane transporter
VRSAARSIDPLASPSIRPRPAGGPRPEDAAESGITRGTPEFRRTVVAMLCAGFATFSLMYCVQPLLPEFAREFGLGAATASLALSLTTGCMGVAMLVLGAASERMGRRPLMIGSMLLAGTLTLASALAPGWGAFLASRALVGVAFAGLPALAMAYLGEEMDPASLPVAMGLYIGGTGVGGMTGRLLTAVLTDLVSWRFAVGAVGVLGLMAALVFWRALPPSRRFVPSAGGTRAGLRAFAAHLRDGTMLRLFAVGFAVLGALVAVYNYATFRLMAPPYRLSQTVVGLVFLLYLAGVGSSGWTGHLLGRVGRRPLLRWSLVLMLAGAAVTLARPLAVVIVGIALLTVGFFAAQSVASGWVAAHARQGRAQGTSLYLCFYYLGSSIAGWAAGHAWEGAGWVGVVAFVTALVAAALLLVWRIPDRPTLVVGS